MAAGGEGGEERTRAAGMEQGTAGASSRYAVEIEDGRDGRLEYFVERLGAKT